MVAAVRDQQHTGMESGEPFPGSGDADRKGICMGDEELLAFCHRIGGNRYGSTSVMLFIPDEELGFFLAMGVLGLFLFLLGVNDIYSVFRCNQKIEAVYCGYNSYPGGRFGITSYAPVFEYICAGKVYHEQTTQTVPYRVLRNMTVGSSYPIYIHSKHPGVYVWKRRIRFTTVLMFAMALLFLTIAIQWLWP